MRIDATLEDGSLTYGECLVPGSTEREVLITTHVCHPSLANDNASGMALLALLGRALGARAERGDLRYSYRLLFIPGTIGSIVWLSRNEDGLDRIDHGLVLTGLGDPGGLTYKRSRRGDATVDRAAAHVLRTRAGAAHRRRLLALRLRRAAVLLPRLRPPGGAHRALAARRVPRVPHVGRRPLLHRAGAARRRARRGHRAWSTCSRATAPT